MGQALDDTRLLSKLADGGVGERTSARREDDFRPMSMDILTVYRKLGRLACRPRRGETSENASTEARLSFASAVEFRKKSNPRSTKSRSFHDK